MQAARLATRLQRELRMLQTDPPPGVCAWPSDDMLTHLEAQIQGPDETVYAKGIFKLEVRVPERYPFEPPNVKFRTPIYHPNIDSGGRICLDILNMPPKGAWKPSLNIPTILASIGLLLAEPNQDDGLMEDITAEYKHSRSSFDAKAKKWTEQYAVQNQLEDGVQQIRESLPLDAGQQETSTTKTIDTTPPTRDAHDSSFGIGFSQEHAQKVYRGVLNSSTEKQSNAAKVENVCGSTSTNQKLNLSMKLTRGKAAKVLDKHTTTDTAAIEASQQNRGIDKSIATRPPSAQQDTVNISMKLSRAKGAKLLDIETTADMAATEASQQKRCIDKSNATRPASPRQDKDKSPRGLSSIETGLRNWTSDERSKASGASSSKTDASLREGNVVNARIIENLPHSPCIDEAEASKHVPCRFNKLSAKPADDLSKFKRPRESTSTTEIVKQQILVNADSPAPLDASTASRDSAPVRKANTAGENGGYTTIQPSYGSAKLSRAEIGSARPEAENLSMRLGKRLREHADSTVMSASFETRTQPSVRVQDSQKLVSNPLKLVRAENSQASARQLEVDSGPSHRQAIPLDAQRLSSNPANSLKEDPSKSGQLGIDNLPAEMGNRSSGNESITAARTEILNQEVEFLDSNIQGPQSHPTPVHGSGTTAAQSVRLEPENLTRRKTEIANESKDNTTVLPQSPGILKEKVINTNINHGAETYMSSSAEKTSSTALQNKVGVLPTSGPSKIMIQECPKALSGQVQPENPSAGVGNKILPPKKARQVNTATLIVLDSESDEEPPKRRSRLSLANRKGMKRK